MKVAKGIRTVFLFVVFLSLILAVNSSQRDMAFASDTWSFENMSDAPPSVIGPYWSTFSRSNKIIMMNYNESQSIVQGYETQIMPDGSNSEWTQRTDGPPVSVRYLMELNNEYAYAYEMYPGYRVFYASVDENGNFVTWSETNAPSTGKTQSCFVATEEYVYVIGGYSGYNDFPPTTSVEYAVIQPDGSLSSWTATESTSNSHLQTSAFIIDSKIYVVGGGMHSYLTDSIEVATIQGDGSLSAWTSGGTTPKPMHGMGWLIQENSIYFFGGNDASYGAGPMDEIYRATITDTGIIDWVQAGILPVGIKYPYAGLINGYVYIISGDPAVVTIKTINKFGLVAHWKFDEGSGTTAGDSAGSNDGTINGATWTDNGDCGNALSFDGVDDYVSVPHDSSYSPTDQITIEVMFKTSDLTQESTLLSKKEGGGYNFQFNRPSGSFFGQLAFDNGDKTLHFPMTDLSINTWHHVAMTYDGTEVKLYLDGVIKDSLPTSGGNFFHNNGCLIFGTELTGSCSPFSSQFAEVVIDEVRIYNRALSVSQIVELYNEGSEYLEIDVSGGPSASSYPVNDLSCMPTLTDDYKTTKILLRKIPSAGQTFNIGSPEDENGRYTNETQHQVTFTEDYYMGVFEITQRQYELVMDTTPSTYAGDMRPVETVSWYTFRGGTWPGDPAGSGQPGSNTFMDRLRSKTGLDFDLPTEAQWEYAARATTIRAYNDYTKNGGEGSDCLVPQDGADANLDPLGRYDYNGGASSHHTVVGSYQENLWGLYDMHGNVWEWCLDWIALYNGDETDPLGPGSGSSRLNRGGGWGSYARGSRSANRSSRDPSSVDYGLGIRLCLPQSASTRKLIAHWKFDGDATDSSGNGNDGTPMGDVSYVTGLDGQAAIFDGDGDCIDCGFGAGENYSELTYNLWVKSASVNGGWGEIQRGGNFLAIYSTTADDADADGRFRIFGRGLYESTIGQLVISVKDNHYYGTVRYDDGNCAVCQGSCHLKFSFKQPHLDLLVAPQQGSNKPYQHDPNS